MSQINPYQLIRLEHLAPSPSNPRKHFDAAELQELADTIADHGVIEPIIVRFWPDDYDTPASCDEPPLYEIVAGERRYRASLLAGLADIPALVRHLDTRQVLEVQVIENLQRRGVNELEEADGYHLMMRDYGYTADELAAKIGKSRAYIYGRLKLTALCETARQAFRAGTLDASRALLIARIPGTTLQEKALKDITESWRGIMSYRDAANHIQHCYMRGLSVVKFPLDATTLHPEAGPCTTCPKRPSNTPELYPDVPSDRAADVCTDPECLSTKADAWLARLAEQAASKGQTVVRGIDHATWLEQFEPLDDPDYDCPEAMSAEEAEDENTPIPTRRDLLGERCAEVEIVLVEHPTTKELIECVRAAEYRQIVPAAEEEEYENEYERSRKANEAEQERRLALFEFLHGRYANKVAHTQAHIVVIAGYLWSVAWPEHRMRVASLLDIPGGAEANILAWLTEHPRMAIAVALDLVLLKDTVVTRYGTPDDPKRLNGIAALYSIDPEKPPFAATSEAASTPPEAPPGGGEAAPQFKVGDRVQVRAGAQFDGGCDITPYNTPGTIQAPAGGDGFDVLFDDGSHRTYIPATALEPEHATTAAHAGGEGADEGIEQAAGAARKTRKSKKSGRASPAGENEVCAERCTRTIDMLEEAAQ